MRGSRKSLLKGFDACGPPANHFPKGLILPRMAKVVSRKVWRFRACRKSFPERFGVSALGGSYFPNGLVFPRMAKVTSRKVWCFRAWRMSFPERFGGSVYGEFDSFYSQIDKLLVDLECLTCNSLFSISFSSTSA